MKHNFKIGDKVKLANSCGWGDIGNSIGEVVRLTSEYIRVDWEGKQLWKKDYPHYPKEIERVVGIGEQLQFPFMTP